MRYPPTNFLRKNMFFIRGFMILFLCCVTIKVNLCSPSIIPCSLKTLSLDLDGHFDFKEVYHAAKDFGNRFQFLPSAVLHPKSVSDIANTIKRVFQLGPHLELTVAARGHGHSLHGQSQAHRGVVINMESLKDQKIHVKSGKFPYVDVYGGELWINVLRESLKHGLSPKSWTDYLHLTVGGTLSNAGISGQAFKHGPQISNVRQLEVVTGKGEVFNCSEKRNSDLFHSVLGGLGQFGIITRARISLEPAPKMVKWIRVLYSDFNTFSRDQELLISAKNTFDYVEGLVIINRTGLLNNWRTSFNPQDPAQASKFKSDGKTLFCLEMAKYFNVEKKDVAHKEIENVLSQLRYISSTLFSSEVPYIEFLDRVHISEILASVACISQIYWSKCSWTVLAETSKRKILRYSGMYYSSNALKQFTRVHSLFTYSVTKTTRCRFLVAMLYAAGRHMTGEKMPESKQSHQG
ncbi:hypothetical protein ACFE04_002677 [Oxalis oulophora]